MIRRVIKTGCSIEAHREARPSIVRVFEAGTVLNMMHPLKPKTARFTIEGEGAENWCCADALIEACAESPSSGLNT